jgi:hypothetical protein
MRTTNIWIVTASLVTAMMPALPSHAGTVEIADEDHNSPVQVTSTTLDGNTVSGTLVNRGGDEVRDIRLLVDIAFLWANEEKPGETSPGRAVVFTVAGPVPPQGTLNFNLHPDPPIEERSDGRYQPKVRVMGYQTITVGKAAP